MKNMKRAYRRHKKHIKFKRRVKNWIRPGINWRDENGNWISFQKARELALKGKGWTSLRTIGHPCSCEVCSPNKYRRPTQSEIKKIIFGD